jgi:hypothetical protein
MTMRLHCGDLSDLSRCIGPWPFTMLPAFTGSPVSQTHVMIAELDVSLLE